jgi:oxygen-dependent protoporphyrinogen oxidase
VTPDASLHVAVIGGGIAGLAAARALEAMPGVRVTVLEGAAAVGGKLRVSDVGGVPVDDGAEQVLVRRPEGRDLAIAVGLGADLVHPAASGAGVWSRGALRALPAGTVMGVPAGLRSLARGDLLTRRERARVALDRWLPGEPLSDDVSVGSHVARRMGRAVVDRLVEPLLGGVWAGRADSLSLAATVPQLWNALREERSLLAAARRAQPTPSAAAGPPFASLRGGLGRLPGAVLADLQRSPAVTVRTSTTVRELRRTPSGWEITVGPTPSPEILTADAVVVAVPARAASRLLAADVPSAAAELAEVDYASVGLITLAFRRSHVGPLPAGTGFLVPPVEGRLAKAATFASAKWGWYAETAPDLVLVRLSVGRHGDEADLQRDDADLVDGVRRDLASMAGVSAAPVDARVTRWGGALPQYAVGHLDRVARLRAAVAAVPGLAVCGAAYDGVGVPACIASGQRAAAEVLARLPLPGTGGGE